LARESLWLAWQLRTLDIQEQGETRMPNKQEYDFNFYLNDRYDRLSIYVYELVEGEYGLQTNTDEIVDRLDLDLSSDDPKVWRAINRLIGNFDKVNRDNIWEIFPELDDWVGYAQVAELGAGDPIIEPFLKSLVDGDTQEGVNSKSLNSGAQMENKTIAITGTDINVGEAVDSIMDKTAELPNDYNMIEADLYGVGINPRDVRADVVVATTELTNKGLDKFREQFPAVESVVL
jgi:hypothetical protein